MYSTPRQRSSRTGKNDKENKSPNIGELNTQKRKALVRQHTLKLKQKEERKELSLKISRHADNGSMSNSDLNGGSFKSKQVGPLSCPRDPLRIPLQSHLPFTTNTHKGRKIYFADSDSSMSTNLTSIQNSSDDGNGKSRLLVNLEGSNRNHIAPAYAFMSAKTNLLEISSELPNAHDYSRARVKKVNGQRQKQPIVYPIAVNGGGVGIHTGADFAKGGINSMSHNRHLSSWGAMKPVLEFPWNLGQSTFSNEKAKWIGSRTTGRRQDRMEPRHSNQDVDLETGHSHDSEENEHDNADHESIQKNPWKIWEEVNNRIKVVNMSSAFGERNIRHLPSSRQAKSSRQSGVYNEDNFDYAIILQPMKEYSDCAAMLNVADEMETSIFDRAIEDLALPTQPSGRKNRKSSRKSPLQQAARSVRRSVGKFSPYRNKRSVSKPNPSSGGRRWKRASPAIKSYREKSPVRSRGKTRKRNQSINMDTQKNANVLNIENIPNPNVPRGMARKQGLEEFLWAMKKGFVVRRFRPGHDPVFLKLYSKDRGDTIHYEYITPEDAITSLKCQIQRFGGQEMQAIGDKKVKISAWAPDAENRPSWNLETKEWEKSESHKRLEQYNASLSEYDGRRSSVGGIIDSLKSYSAKAVHSGSFKAADLVNVQRATHEDCLSRPDPYSEPTLFGSHTFRGCMDILKAKYVKESELLMNRIDEKYGERDSSIKDEEVEAREAELVNKFAQKLPVETRTFSIIVPSLIQRFSSLKEANDAWYTGQASFKSFSFLDLETATDGEYWMLFRGFLLLNRDAVNGE